MAHRIALSHASGLVAEAILEKLPESGLAPDSLVLLDRQAQAGKRIAYGDTHLTLQDQMQFDLSECSLLLMTQEDPELQSAVLQQGCLLVSHALDATEDAVFLSTGGEDPVISYSASQMRLPSAEVSCLLPTLLALDELGDITGLHITLLRSAEFHGKAGVDELASQTVSLLNSRAIEPAVYSQQIAFNLLPEFAEVGMTDDICRFLGKSSCSPTLQTVNVPLFHGFAAAVQLEFAQQADFKACQKRLSGIDGVILKAAESSPITDCNQSFDCTLSHLQQRPNQSANLQFWMIADPMRYGLANNYVNVADFLLKSFL